MTKEFPRDNIEDHAAEGLFQIDNMVKAAPMLAKAVLLADSSMDFAEESFVYKVVDEFITELKTIRKGAGLEAGDVARLRRTTHLFILMTNPKAPV